MKNELLPELSFDYLGAAKTGRGPLAEMSAEKIQELALRYRRFLNLKAMHPELPIAPTEIIDEMWHLHMLHPRAYYNDCMKLFGFILDHHPGYGSDEESRPALDRTFARTCRLWEERYNEPYAIPGEPLQGVIICADEEEPVHTPKPKPQPKPQIEDLMAA